MPSTSSLIGGGDSSSIGGARGATAAAVQGTPLARASVSHHRRAHSLFPLRELSLTNLPPLNRPQGTGREIGIASTSRSFATAVKNVSATMQLPIFQLPPSTTPGVSASSSTLTGSSSRIASHKLKRRLSIDTALAEASYSRHPRKVLITADENDQGAAPTRPVRLGPPFELRRLAPGDRSSGGSFQDHEVVNTVLAASTSTLTAPTSASTMTATIRAPAAPRALRRPSAPPSNDLVRSDFQDQTISNVTFPNPVVRGDRNTGQECAPSRSNHSRVVQEHGLRRSARASVTSTSYYDSSDLSDSSSSGPRHASTSQLRPRGRSASRQAISLAPSTSDDDDDFAPALSPRLSYPDDARKISEAEAELRVQSSRARDMSGDKGRVLFAKTWLQSCYEPCKGFNVSRSALYASYVTACQRYSVSALNTATFGKMIRAVHPNVLTRRLGGRTDSRYHYIDFRPSNSQEYNTLFAGEAKRDAENAASGEQSRVPSPFRATEPLAVVVEPVASKIVGASSSLTQKAVELVEVEATATELAKTAEMNQPRSLTRRRAAAVTSTRTPIPSRRPTRASSTLVASNIEQDESPAMPLFHSKLLRSFEAVFKGDEFENQDDARLFWQSLGLHFSRLEEAVRVEKYELFLDELRGWWTERAANECDIAVLPAASRGIYRAFVAIYESVLEGSRKALLALPLLAQLESLGILAAKIESATIEALQEFSGTFFFDTLVALSKQVGSLFALSQSCRVWANNLQSGLGAQQTLIEFEQAWRSLDAAIIQQRCELIKPIDLTRLHHYTALVEVLFEPPPISPSIEHRLGRVVEQAALSFEDLLAGQDKAASIIAECNLIGSQFARELCLSHPAVATSHFQSLHFLIEDLLILHVFQGQVLQTEKIVSAPGVRPAVTAGQTAALEAGESNPEGTVSPTVDETTEPVEVEDKTEETTVVDSQPLLPPPSSNRHSSPTRDNVFASPPRMSDSAPNGRVTSLPIPSIVRQSPAASLTDKPHPVSSSPMWMPPRRAPLVVQAVQRANLAQDLLALQSPPPFVLSPRMLQSFADRQREGGPVRARSPVIGAYEWSNERRGVFQQTLGVEVEGLDEVEGVGSNTAAAGGRGGVLLDPAADLTTEVPNTAAYYAGYWR